MQQQPGRMQPASRFSVFCCSVSLFTLQVPLEQLSMKLHMTGELAFKPLVCCAILWTCVQHIRDMLTLQPLCMSLCDHIVVI